MWGVRIPGVHQVVVVTTSSLCPPGHQPGHCPGHPGDPYHGRHGHSLAQDGAQDGGERLDVSSVHCQLQ